MVRWRIVNTEQKTFPWELIGEKFEDARLRIYGVFPDPDTDDLDLYEEVVESWYAVDKERRYFHLSVVDGIVTTISWGRSLLYNG